MRTSGILFFSLMVFLVPLLAESQSLGINGNVYTSSTISLNNQTPFWFWANQTGQVQPSSDFQQIGVVALLSSYTFKGGQNLLIGTRLAGSLGEKNDFTATEIFGGYGIGKVIIKAGAWSDSLIQSGLSSSNGNLLNSGNARPYPKVGISSDGFVKIGKRNFYMAGVWEEGVLYDKRVVNRPRLHHKNLFFRWGKVENFQFESGIDHYAFWGGTSLETGPEPVGFSDYLRTIFALKGGKRASLSDQMNVAGNSLGQYFFIFRKSWEKIRGEVRIVHPFEDKSGMVFFNGFDNLYSLYLTFKEVGLVNHTLIEFLYTVNQTGSPKQLPDGTYIDSKRGDNYLNHGFYRSGFTYFGNVMGSPLFYPVSIDSNGISLGIGNNRIVAFHLGIDGKLTKNFNWKALTSYSLNRGTYGARFEPVRKQFSGLVELTYSTTRFPLYLKFGFAFDRGSNLSNGITKSQPGFQYVVGKTF